MRALTDGYGVHPVLKRVGLAKAMQTAIEITRRAVQSAASEILQGETMRVWRPAVYNNASVGGRRRRRAEGVCVARVSSV